MTRDFTFERPAGKLKLARGAEVEMAWRDGEASPAAAAPRAPVPRRRPAGALRGQPAAGRRAAPPPSRTKWTRLVHPSVLIGHV
jgi:hypothetical protein